MRPWQINEDSLFNADECELYATIWGEFDEDLTGRISIENLRPLIERLCDAGVCSRVREGENLTDRETESKETKGQTDRQCVRMCWVPS